VFFYKNAPIFRVRKTFASQPATRLALGVMGGLQAADYTAPRTWLNL
jgi:hypothetical protein